MTYDLLIIYADGTQKIVKGVSGYKVNQETGCFVYTKNDYNAFLPIESVRFMGKWLDYNEE